MQYPKIYLAIDNCFASKRWTEPIEWMKYIKDVGVNFVEASADNECDPLYSPNGYLEEWCNQILEASSKTGVKIANLYSGHGTYSTLGLSHTNRKVGEHMRDKWLKKMIDTASALDAGLGFFTHAFNQSTLLNKPKYEIALQNLISDFTELGNYAASTNIKTIGVEQMYTPHQIPWTINGAFDILQKINLNSVKPFYITIDVGHQSGQRKFLVPTSDQIIDYLNKTKEGKNIEGLWLGSVIANDLFSKASNSPKSEYNNYLEKIMFECENNPHLFATYDDGDPYLWLENLACYSPIIHLQQTDGKSSAHRPFTKEWNDKGIINGKQVLESIKKSYENSVNKNMPKKCDEIYLTIEVFSATADMPRDIKHRLMETVKYWRNYIPEDGIRLNSIL